MRIGIIEIGYARLVQGVVLADFSMKVMSVDNDTLKIGNLRNGM